MLFLEAAAQAAGHVAEAAANHAAEEAPAFETGSILHPLYALHILDGHILPEPVLISLGALACCRFRTADRAAFAHHRPVAP